MPSARDGSQLTRQTWRMTTNGDTHVWPTLRCRDTKGLVAFLVEAFGFEQTEIVEHGGTVVHAEIRWPAGGGVMLGDDREPEDELHARLPTGPVSIYVVCDDPDGLFERARSHGAEVLRGLTDEDYGSRGFAVKDPEGNVWTFGTYAGA